MEKVAYQKLEVDVFHGSNLHFNMEEQVFHLSIGFIEHVTIDLHKIGFYAIQNRTYIRVDWMSEIELCKLEIIVHQRNLGEHSNHANISACASRGPRVATVV